LSEQLNVDVIKLVKINDELSQFLKDLALAEEINNKNANSFVATANDPGIKLREGVDDGMREALTLREYLIQFQESGLELKLKINEMLRDPILTKKIGLFEKGKLINFVADTDKAFTTGRKLIDGAKKYLGDDYLTISDPSLHQGAIQLMSKRMSRKNTQN